MRGQVKSIAVTTTRAEVLTLVGAISVLVLLNLVCPLTGNAGNQFVIGPIVNATLIYAGLRLRHSFNVFAVVLVPSLCAATLGLLGVSAVFMMYMIPFIWIGNTALAFTVRFVSKYKVGAVMGVVTKCTVIFGGFLLLQGFGVFPGPVAEMFAFMMGTAQIITATIGAVIAFGMIKVTKYLSD